MYASKKHENVHNICYTLVEMIEKDYGKLHGTVLL